MTQNEMEHLLKEFIEERMMKLVGTINADLDYTFVDCNVKEGILHLRFPLKAWQMNPKGHLHGGMVCTILDTSMGCLAYAMSGGYHTPTVDMSTSFIASSNEGEHLIVEVALQHGGSRIMKVEAKAICEERNQLVASSMGTYIVNNRKANAHV
ncbi:MAG: PaaI family thioesterase [Erysipelotrichaceae bacterium]